MTALFYKALVGALAVVCIALLSKTKSFYIAGLVPLFPTFALIAHYIVGKERTMTDLRETCLFGLCSLIPYAAYLLSVYILSFRLPLSATLTVSTLIWVTFALFLLLIWMQVT